MRAKHEEKIMNLCDQCEYKTDKPGNLVTHMETHLKEQEAQTTVPEI